jgi:hypothetical protein
VLTRTADQSAAHLRGVQIGLFTAIALCLLLQAWLATTLEINWDEFFFLSQIYDYQRGEMTSALQTLHVHLIGWITSLPGNEVDQVVAGRFVMLAFLTGTCVLIFRLARTFFSPAASAIAVLAFASAGPTIIHSASFRVDPIAAFFIMLSLVTLARGRMSLGPMLLAGTSAAVAAMLTIKVGLYATAFTGIAVWRLCDTNDRRKALRWLAGAALIAAIGFALLYALQLSLVAKATNASAQAMLGNAARAQFLEYGFLPRRSEIWRAALLSPVQTILLVAGAIGVTIAIIWAKGGDRCKLLAVAGGGATLLCLPFYRNAFPYFFPFIMPPAMLLVAWIVEWSSLLRGRIGVMVLAISMLVPAAMVAKTWSERGRPPQRQVVATVHEIFPQPVLMIDHSHMIGSFPKRGFFMSTWGMANYRANPPIFVNILRRETVPLLLLDSPRLAEAVGTSSAMKSSERLHDEDRDILRQNFVEHWGPIWVAGKRLVPITRSGQFEILIPGAYTLEGASLVIDAKAIPDGGVVQLTRGQHRFEANSQSARMLRWGNHLPRPKRPGPSGPLFVGF